MYTISINNPLKKTFFSSSFDRLIKEVCKLIRTYDSTEFHIATKDKIISFASETELKNILNTLKPTTSEVNHFIITKYDKNSSNGQITNYETLFDLTITKPIELKD